MEDSLELANYLPLSFKTPKEEEYIAFLWDAFETNYQAEKYQFAFSTVKERSILRFLKLIQSDNSKIGTERLEKLFDLYKKMTTGKGGKK